MPQRLDYEAIAPQGVRALGEVYRYIARSELDALLVELIYTAHFTDQWLRLLS